MKKIILLSSLAASLFFVQSCKDDYLDTAPTETVSQADAQTKLNGLYLMMIKTGTGGTNLDQDDFGQKGYDIYSDLMSSDMVLRGTNYGWYSRIANLSDQVDFTRNTNYKPWRYYYRVIKGANDIIADLGGTDAVPTTNENKFAMGQAKALRAYAYFYLLQFFTKSYDAAAPAIPLYTSFDQEAQPKSTQLEVYNLIISDLTTAIDYLDNYDRPEKGIIDQSVAKGYLAYTYAAMGNNAAAAATSQEIMTQYGYPLTSKMETVYMAQSAGAQPSGGGFNNLNTASWMWGMDLRIVHGLDLVSWWGQMDPYTYSYAWAGDPKGMDHGLWQSIRTDDIRRSQFQTGANHIALNKFFDPKRVAGGQREVETDYIYMRVDEFHLLAAETLAKSGNEAQAKVILKNFMANRLTTPTAVSYIDALSGQALQDEIYKNTRIEFFGEGKSYLAMKRNRATVTRGSNHLFFAGQSFSYDDDRFYLKIPQQEILDNPHF